MSSARTHIYWADGDDAYTTIERVNLNGTGATEDFTTGAQAPCVLRNSA